MKMEPTESSETSAINVTWTPASYPKDNKLQLEQGESLKSGKRLLNGGVTGQCRSCEQANICVEYLKQR